MRIAIAHDYLTQRGGAERVVLVMAKAFPDATIYTTLYDPDGTYPEFAERQIITSPLNKVGFLRQRHRYALPLLPWAAGTLRIDADVVVVSTSGWAHGFPTSGRRVVYCYSPARWLYLTASYLGGPWWRSPTGWMLGVLRPFLLRWDRRRALKAHESGPYLAISRVVEKRIQQAYGFESKVVPAPHSASAAAPQAPVTDLEDWAPGGYHLLVSRLLPYKNVTAAVEAFRTLPGQRLVVVGRGPLWDQLNANLPPNVRMLQGLTDAQLAWVYAHCTMLVAPSFEDFGLTPLEAGVYGKPTLALRGGGYLDTIAEGRTGEFFEEPTAAAIATAVTANAGKAWDPDVITAHVETFSERHFIAELQAQVAQLAGD